MTTDAVVGKRPRQFAIAWERGSQIVSFNGAADGKQLLVVDAKRFSEQTREELMVYGMRQIFPDAVASVVGAEAKLAAMKELHKEMLADEWRLGARATRTRLVMEQVYLAGRELGMLFPSITDDEVARKKWTETTEYNRLRFSAKDEIVDYLAERNGQGQDLDEDIFA